MLVLLDVIAELFVVVGVSVLQMVVLEDVIVEVVGVRVVVVFEEIPASVVSVTEFVLLPEVVVGDVSVFVVVILVEINMVVVGVFFTINGMVVALVIMSVGAAFLRERPSPAPVVVLNVGFWCPICDRVGIRVFSPSAETLRESRHAVSSRAVGTVPRHFSFVRTNNITMMRLNKCSNKYKLRVSINARN